MTKNISSIEKCAKLMGCEKVDDIGFIRIEPDGSRGTWFNPRTNKADLMDLECALGIAIYWDGDWVSAFSFAHPTGDVEAVAHYANHPTKFAARAEAVIAVAVKIYDRREE